VWALAFALAHVALVYVAARALFAGARSASAIACVVSAYALTIGMPGEDALALNGESLQLPLVLGGAVLGAAALVPAARGGTWRLLAAGVLFGAAIAVKQSAALHP